MVTLHDSPDSAVRQAQRTAEQESPHTKATGRKPPLREQAQGIIASAIGNHPMASIGVALAAGIVLGCWIKRR